MTDSMKRVTNVFSSEEILHENARVQTLSLSQAGCRINRILEHKEEVRAAIISVVIN